MKRKLRIGGPQKLQPRLLALPKWDPQVAVGPGREGLSGGFRLEASLAHTQRRATHVLQCVPGGLDTVVFSW